MNKTLLTIAAVAALGTTAATVQAMGEKPAATATAVTAMATQSQAEMEHRVKTLETGKLALETSKVALSNATSPMVKEFAKAEVAEQTTIAEVFKSMYPTAPEIGLTTENTEKLAKLKAVSPKDFDKAYIALQIDGHKQLLDVQDTYLAKANNREEANVTKLARGQIREHIILLDAFKKHM